MNAPAPRKSDPQGRFGKSHPFPGIFDDSSLVVSLMNRVIDNDDRAFATLFNMMYAPLCRSCLRLVQIHEVAEELVSDVFYTLWKNRERMELRSHHAYLFTAVRNRGIDYLRKTKRNMLCDLDAAIHIPVDMPDSQEMMVGLELSDSIQKSIASLPSQRRLIFALSRDHGLMNREIATKLNISVKTVETQMGRALRHLHHTVATT